MKPQILIAAAIAAALAAPAAAQMSPGADKHSGATSARDRFESYDRNKDGYISRNEARDAAWASRFSELDKDNDGRISRSEFAALQKQ